MNIIKKLNSIVSILSGILFLLILISFIVFSCDKAKEINIEIDGCVNKLYFTLDEDCAQELGEIRKIKKITAILPDFISPIDDFHLSGSDQITVQTLNQDTTFSLDFNEILLKNSEISLSYIDNILIFTITDFKTGFTILSNTPLLFIYNNKHEQSKIVNNNRLIFQTNVSDKTNNVKRVKIELHLADPERALKLCGISIKELSMNERPGKNGTKKTTSFITGKTTIFIKDTGKKIELKRDALIYPNIDTGIINTIFIENNQLKFRFNGKAIALKRGTIIENNMPSLINIIMANSIIAGFTQYITFIVAFINCVLTIFIKFNDLKKKKEKKS